jgi:hypothetical protein
MKYLKAYEKHIIELDKYKVKLKIGDYIIFKDKYMNHWKDVYKGLFNCGKIINGNSNYNYTIAVSTLSGIINFYLDKTFIERKATTKEKEELEIKLTANKYNI